MRKKRILTICAGGNCRSVTLATLLKYNFGGHDALACSIEKNSGDTLDMLIGWADVIHPVDDEIEQELRDAVKPYVIPSRVRVQTIPIGKDHWGLSMHPGLVIIVYPLLVAAGYTANKTVEEIIARGSKYSLRRGAADPLDGV